jgi:hypothetical protein
MRIRVGSEPVTELWKHFFKYYCFYSNLLVYLYCNNLIKIWNVKKTIIKGGTTISPKQQYNTNEEAIKACKFLNSYPDRTQKIGSI